MDKNKEETEEENQFEEMIQGLLDDKFGCCNGFINTDTVTGRN